MLVTRSLTFCSFGRTLSHANRCGNRNEWKNNNESFNGLYASKQNYNVGLTTTDGIYINNTCVYKGDCSGPVSAGVVLLIHWSTLQYWNVREVGSYVQVFAFNECDIAIVTKCCLRPFRPERYLYVGRSGGCKSCGARICFEKRIRNFKCCGRSCIQDERIS